MTEGRLLPTLFATLRDYYGAFDLTDATAVTFIAMDAGGVNKIAATACTILNPPSAGRVSYAWATADLDTPGEYRCQFLVTIGGRIQSFPSDGYINLQVQESPA